MTTTETVPAGDPRVLAVINGKGGVFKSSIVASLAEMLAAAGWRILIIDFDDQGNQAEELGLGNVTDEGRHQLQVVPFGEPLQPQPTGRERLDIVFGGELLEDMDDLVSGRRARDPLWMHSLAKSIEAVADDYHLILIDCPPGYPTLQMLALVAARFALIPARSDSSSRKGLRKIARRFGPAREHNPDLELLGVVRTGITVSARTIREKVRTEILQDLGDLTCAGGASPVLDTCIRYAESPAKDVRDKGMTPHELEGGRTVEQLKQAQFELLRRRREEQKLAARGGKRKASKRPEPETVLSPSISGLAKDYAELTQEVSDRLDAAWNSEEVTA